MVALLQMADRVVVRVALVVVCDLINQYLTVFGHCIQASTVHLEPQRSTE